MQQIASKNAPSTGLVIPHFAIGALLWLFAIILTAIYPETFTQHYFSPKLLAITHLVVLGWISMIIFGALYQLIPVILEVKLYSEILGKISLFTLTFGTLMLAYVFWNNAFKILLHMAVSLLLIAVLLFTINVFTTAAKAEKQSIEKKFILTSAFWLLLTVSLGIIAAFNLSQPFLAINHLDLLKIHAHWGIIGWFLQLIIGVGSKLLPMFMIAHQLNTKKLTLAYFAINLGILNGTVALFINIDSLIYTSVAFTGIGIVSFLSYLLEAYKKRIKKSLDKGMKQSMISFLILIIPVLIMLVLQVNSPDINVFKTKLSLAYGTTLLMGFISSLVMGQTYKTLPFIVWLKVYKNRVGKGKIPFPNDLYSETIAAFQLWSFTIGFITFLCGILIHQLLLLQLGSVLMLIAVILYTTNVFKIIFHQPTRHE